MDKKLARRIERMRMGLQVQDACNLSGVALGLTRMMNQVRDDAGDEYCTDMLGKDEGVILFVAKMADLCKIDVDWVKGSVSNAYSLATELVNATKRPTEE